MWHSNGIVEMLYWDDNLRFLWECIHSTITKTTTPRWFEIRTKPVFEDTQKIIDLTKMPRPRQVINKACVLHAPTWSVVWYSKTLILDDLTHVPLEKNDRHFPSDILKFVFVNEKFCISIINDDAAMVQVMAWRRTGGSHYLNQCWPSSQTHICDTRGKWVPWNWNRKHASNLHAQMPATEIYRCKG